MSHYGLNFFFSTLQAYPQQSVRILASLKLSFSFLTFCLITRSITEPKKKGFDLLLPGWTKQYKTGLLWVFYFLVFFLFINNSVSAKAPEGLTYLQACQNVLQREPQPSADLSTKARQAYKSFHELRQGLPLSIHEVLEAHPDKRVGDLIIDIIKLRQSIADDLHDLAGELKAEPIIEKLLRSGADSVLPPPKEMKRAHQTHDDLGKTTWAQLKGSQRSQLLGIIVHFYSPLYHKLNELEVAFLVPQVVSLNPLVRDTLPKRLQNVSIPYKKTDLADKELDVIFKQGQAWAEVKSTTSPWHPGSVDSLIAQTQKMRTAASVVGQHTHKEIEIHYFFIGERPPHETLCLLKNWGIVVYWATHIDEMNYESSIVHTLNCEPEGETLQ